MPLISPPSLHASRSSTTSPIRGSTTQTLTETRNNDANDVSPTVATATLRLRGAHDPAQAAGERRRRPAIRWAENVVDNEGMGRKNSKVCCIYHRPRAVGESSSEEDSSSSPEDSSSDGGDDGSGVDDGAAKPIDGGRGRTTKRRRHHHQAHDSDHNHGKDEVGGNPKRGGRRKASPNAYERMPKKSKGRKGTKEG